MFGLFKKSRPKKTFMVTYSNETHIMDNAISVEKDRFKHAYFDCEDINDAAVAFARTFFQLNRSVYIHDIKEVAIGEV